MFLLPNTPLVFYEGNCKTTGAQIMACCFNIRLCRRMIDNKNSPTDDLVLVGLECSFKDKSKPFQHMHNPEDFN